MIKILFSLYIFISVNDLVLYALNALQLKNVLLGAALVSVFAWGGQWYKRQVRILYFLAPLVIISVLVGLTSGQGVGGVLQQAFSVLVAVLVPLMIDRYVGEDENRWNYVSDLVMVSLVAMMAFKIIFVLYQMGFVGNPIFDLLFQNIQGRGEIDGIARLNTGTQLLMLYGLTLCIVRLLKSAGGRRLLYILISMLFVLDLFIASSRFFTIIAPLVIVFTLGACNIKIPKSVFVGVGICVLIVAFFLVQDIYSARVIASDGGDTIREDQTAAMIDAFFNSPFLGHGSGYALPSLTRNDDAPFLYEVQIVAFLMQFGIFGTILYMLVLFNIIKPHIRAGLRLLAFFYVCIFFLASYFNPYMLGTYAGLSIAMINLILRELSLGRSGVKQ